MNYKETIAQLIITYNLYFNIEYPNQSKVDIFEAIKKTLINASYFELLQLRNELLYNQLVETSITDTTLIMSEITTMLTKIINNK